MDVNGTPAQHPQSGARLPIAQVDPGEQRDQYRRDYKQDDLLRLEGHIPFTTV